MDAKYTRAIPGAKRETHITDRGGRDCGQMLARSRADKERRFPNRRSRSRVAPNFPRARTSLPPRFQKRARFRRKGGPAIWKSPLLARRRLRREPDAGTMRPMNTSIEERVSALESQVQRLAQAIAPEAIWRDGWESTVGMSASAEPAEGYRLDRWSTPLGNTNRAFALAVC